MEWIRSFVKSILAGIMISVGCVVNLSCDNKYIGAILFCIGLITILLFNFNLYTGKVCYIPNNKPSYILQILLILFGNILGCIIMGVLFPITPLSICTTKLSYDLQTVLIKSIMCGLLIYIAVDSYKKYKTLLPTLFCIPIFILSGYIHVIADTFYFVSAQAFNTNTIIYILVAAIGNAFGGMIIPFLYNTKLID